MTDLGEPQSRSSAPPSQTGRPHLMESQIARVPAVRRAVIGRHDQNLALVIRVTGRNRAWCAEV
jgi:hypothetical protein